MHVAALEVKFSVPGPHAVISRKAVNCFDAPETIIVETLQPYNPLGMKALPAHITEITLLTPIGMNGIVI